MRTRLVVLTVAAVILAILLANMIAYQVKFTDVALVETFGKVSGPVEPGLHFKWPWPIQRVIRYDKRVQELEDMYESSLTHDNVELLVSVYAFWRVADPVKFRTEVSESLDVGQRRLRDLVRNAKKDVVGQHDLVEFVSVEPNVMKLKAIEEEIYRIVAPQALDKYGLRVEQVGVKRLALPEAVTRTVMENMRSERQRRAAAFRGQGQAFAKRVTSEADSLAEQITSFARRKAQDIRSQGLSEAAKHYGVFQQNQDFAIFLSRLDALADILKANTSFLLDGSTERAFGYFQQPPTEKEIPRGPASPAAEAPPAGATPPANAQPPRTPTTAPADKGA